MYEKESANMQPNANRLFAKNRLNAAQQKIDCLLRIGEQYVSQELVLFAPSRISSSQF